MCIKKEFFKSYDITEASCLFWYQLYSIPLYILAIPLESVREINALPVNKDFSWAWNNQAAAFRCFIGSPKPSEFPIQCANKIAWIWVTVFVVGFVGMFFYKCQTIQSCKRILDNSYTSINSIYISIRICYKAIDW